MNGSIFGDAENEGRQSESIRLAAAPQITGAAREDANRQRTEGMEGCELAGVVFPQGKHEHILARGLFRQIGDCCERKGSSDAAAAASTTTSSLTNTTIRRLSVATAISAPHQGTTPRRKHIALPIGERMRERDIILKSAVNPERERQR